MPQETVAERDFEAVDGFRFVAFKEWSGDGASIALALDEEMVVTGKIFRELAPAGGLVGVRLRRLLGMKAISPAAEE